MPTGKSTSYDLTQGVIVDMSPTIYFLSPVDAPLITGVGGDGLSVLATDTTNQKKIEWQDESILTPRSSLAASITTTTAYITVASGDQTKFSTGDMLLLGNDVEWVQVTGYGTTADTLLITRAIAGTAGNHTTSEVVIGVGTALAEGSDPENARTADRTGRYNVTQIFGPTAVHMSRTEAKVGKYGVADEWNHQLMNRIKENVISREQALLYGQRYESTTTKTRTMGGLQYYIASQGNVDSSTTTLSATAIQTALQTNYNNGGVPDRLIANPGAFVNITDVGTVTTILEDRQSGFRGRAPAQVVLTQFGPVSLVPDRWVRKPQSDGGNAFLISRENVTRRIFDPLQFEWLAKTGDARKGQVVAEESLEVKGAQQMTLFSGLTG